MSDFGGGFSFDVRPRAVDAELYGRWTAEESRLSAFLASVGATSPEGSFAIELIPVRYQDSADLQRRLSGDEDLWTYTTSNLGDEGLVAWAVPVRTHRADSFATFHVPIHTQISAWWLTQAWRISQLAEATAYLAAGGLVIPAAATARSFLETSAALLQDTRKVAGLWATMKSHRDDDAHLRACRAFLEEVRSIVFGAKFVSKDTPEPAGVFGHIERANVLGGIRKLAKSHGQQVFDDWAYLCNTVHPSVGTALSFSPHGVMHGSGTHMLRWVSRRPMRLIETDRPGHLADNPHSYVPAVIARSAIVAFRVSLHALDASLRIVDDVGLTTNASAAATVDYWRNLGQPDRNESCPCRSGAKWKRCIHKWGSPAPVVED